MLWWIVLAELLPPVQEDYGAKPGCRRVMGAVGVDQERGWLSVGFVFLRRGAVLCLLRDLCGGGQGIEEDGCGGPCDPVPPVWAGGETEARSGRCM